MNIFMSSEQHYSKNEYNFSWWKVVSILCTKSMPWLNMWKRGEVQQPFEFPPEEMARKMSLSRDPHKISEIQKGEVNVKNYFEHQGTHTSFRVVVKQKVLPVSKNSWIYEVIYMLNLSMMQGIPVDFCICYLPPIQTHEIVKSKSIWVCKLVNAKHSSRFLPLL